MLLIAVAGLVIARCSRLKVQNQKPPSEPNLITFSKIDKAWRYSRGENTKVAVCDWFFDMSPKASAKYTEPTSMVPGEQVGSSNPWHGEWMAEIVRQVAPGAKIIPIRARLDESYKRGPDGRYRYEKYLLQGIRYAADQGAVAVTNSMGPVTQCHELQETIDYAEQKGTIFIDVHPETKTSPNALDQRIIHAGVVAVPKHRTRPERGRDIYVRPYEMHPAFKDGWGFSNGPPIVAGVIALMKGANPKLTPAQARGILVETAENRDSFAVLDAQAAVKKAVALKDR